eukprot:CAMPEP_0202015334 /NCGR_PEP_ID=MMETSP0905-20130828/31681_1 /ASSEMBLY_ACC=CAM_ASM_000554 /TAXON_ID=420261 /ORGANISM="Thalassiosira antarctica, Strain CCMP982" /LENGTH=77 /DNA_ID=CAMNT_0048575469 /DNA_START=14 /DNA_END=244 /DNA_ORIENTATION=-
MPMNSRRQTLGVQTKPSSKPSGGTSGSNGSVDSGNTSRRRVAKSRKSMIPRCAGSATGTGVGDNINREHNGRASGLP